MSPTLARASSTSPGFSLSHWAGGGDGPQETDGNITEWATSDPTRPVRWLGHLPCQGWTTASPTSEMTHGPPCSPPMCHYYGCRCQPRSCLMTERLFLAIQAVHCLPVDSVLETSSPVSMFMTGHQMTSAPLEQRSP